MVIDGKPYSGVDITLHPETIERIRVGRMCGQCFEPFETEWPATCSLCGVRPREAWKLLFEKGYFQGVKHVGPSVDLHEEIDRLDAELEEDNWRDRAQKAGIVIPHIPGVSKG